MKDSIINKYKKEWQQISDLRQRAHSLLEAGDYETAASMMVYIEKATKALATQQTSEIAAWEKATGKKVHPAIKLIIEDMVAGRAQ